MASVTEALLTAEQYATLPDPGHPEELVRGKIVPMPMPKPRHGYICNKAGRILGNFVEEHQLGWVLNNDTGVITERDPDTVRGGGRRHITATIGYPRGELPEITRKSRPNWSSRSARPATDGRNCWPRSPSISRRGFRS